MQDIIICVDKGQKDGHHEVKHKEIARLGNLQFVPLPYGDYILGSHEILSIINRRGHNLKKMDFCGVPKISVDSKANMEEIYGNIIGKSHARFRDECILAQNNGCKLIVLVENENGINNLSEVRTWENPRLKRYYYFRKLKEQGKAQNVKLAKKPPCSSKQLQTAMETMQEKYGVQFLFCKKSEAGKKILELLTSTNVEEVTETEFK
jgi:ribosome-associated protein